MNGLGVWHVVNLLPSTDHNNRQEGMIHKQANKINEYSCSCTLIVNLYLNVNLNFILCILTVTLALS